MDSEYRANVGDSQDRQPTNRDYHHQQESGERTHQSQYRRYSDADRGKYTSKYQKMSIFYHLCILVGTIKFSNYKDNVFNSQLGNPRLFFGHSEKSQGEKNQGKKLKLKA